MASGDIAAIVEQLLYPDPGTVAPATPDVRLGGSGENIEVHDFDASTDEYLDFLCYALTAVGITITFQFMMSTATSGNIEIEAAIRRLDSAEDVDSSHTYSVQASGAVSVPSTSGVSKQTTVSFTTGAQMDSLAAGERFVLRINRNVGVASNAAGDMELMGWPVITET